MWNVYKYHAWLERRSIRQFALISAGINLASMIIVLAVAWLIVPHSWIAKLDWGWVAFYVVMYTVVMAIWQTRQRRKQSGR